MPHSSCDFLRPQHVVRRRSYIRHSLLHLRMFLPKVIGPLMISGDFFMSLIAAMGRPQLATGPQKCCNKQEGERRSQSEAVNTHLPTTSAQSQSTTFDCSLFPWSVLQGEARTKRGPAVYSSSSPVSTLQVSDL